MAEGRLLLSWSRDSRHVAFRNCRVQAQSLQLADPRVQAHKSWYMCLAVPQPVGTSQTRDQTHIACMAKWILNHWPTREAPIC